MFLAIYSLEFVLKVYAEPINYWLSAYNLFDFIVLVISGVQVTKLPINDEGMFGNFNLPLIFQNWSEFVAHLRFILRCATAIKSVKFTAQHLSQLSNQCLKVSDCLRCGGIPSRDAKVLSIRVGPCDPPSANQGIKEGCQVGGPKPKSCVEE